MNTAYIGEKIFCKNSSFKCQARPPERGQRAGTHSKGWGPGLEELGWPVGTASPTGRPWEVVPRCEQLLFTARESRGQGWGRTAKLTRGRETPGKMELGRASLLWEGQIDRHSERGGGELGSKDRSRSRAAWETGPETERGWGWGEESRLEAAQQRQTDRAREP